MAFVRLRLSKKLTIKIAPIFDHLFDRELISRFVSSGLAQLFQKIAVIENKLRLTCELRTSASEIVPVGGDDPTGFFVRDKFAGAGDVGCKDGDARRHRFKDPVRLTLVGAGRPVEIEVRYEPQDVVSGAEEVNVIFDAYRFLEADQTISHRSVAKHEEMNIVPHDFEQVGGPDRVFDPFLRFQSSGHAD